MRTRNSIGRNAAQPPKAVLVAGSANLDFVVRADTIPAPGQTVLGGGFQAFPGGKGANQAVACARAGGAATHMLLSLGDDAFAAPLQASLVAAGVELHRVPASSQPTGVAFICVDSKGENAITVAPGANTGLLPQHLPPLQPFSHLLLQLETPLATVAAYAKAAHGAGLCVVLNAAPAQALPASLLACVDVLVVNVGELFALAPHGLAGSLASADNASADAIEAAMRSLGLPSVVVTRGAQGSLLLHQGQVTAVPAFAVTVVDTTGAGDTFCGTLVAALSQGNALPVAARRASAAAALACTALGAQAGVPTRAALDALLATGAHPGTGAEPDAAAPAGAPSSSP
jgi:ribokinase